MKVIVLPPGITGTDECALIDSGCGLHAQRTLALPRAPQVLGRRRLDRLINTHRLKWFFVFALLARDSIAHKELPVYFERVPCYRNYNKKVFRLTPVALAERLLDDLLRAGVIAQREGELVPAARG
jgi:hypothetical protein